ncbi:MAG: hypothetical protein ACR2H5_26710 [Ktedonobacteraceae bacterium]
MSIDVPKAENGFTLVLYQINEVSAQHFALDFYVLLTDDFGVG